MVSKFFFLIGRQFSQSVISDVYPFRSCHNRSAKGGATIGLQMSGWLNQRGGKDSDAHDRQHPIPSALQVRNTDLRMKLGTSCASEVESCFMKSAASLPHRPPVSMPTNNDRTQPALSTWLPCPSSGIDQHSGVDVCRVPVKNSMRLPSLTATPALMSRRYALKRTRALASRHTLCHASTEGARSFVAPKDVQDTVAPFECRFSDWQWQLQSF